MALRKDKRANYTEGLDGGNMHELQRGKDAKATCSSSSNSDIYFFHLGGD